MLPFSTENKQKNYLNNNGQWTHFWKGVYFNVYVLQIDTIIIFL